MTDPIAVRGTITKYSTAPDGSLRLTVDLDEVQTSKFHQIFTPGVGVGVAIARLWEEGKGRGDDSGP